MRLFEIQAGFTMPRMFYHGTSDTLAEVIEREGLVPRPSHDNPERVAVYLTDKEYVASEYADLSTDRRGGEPAMFAIDPRHLNPAALEPDDYDTAYMIRDLLIRKPGDTIGLNSGVEFEHFQDLAPYRHWKEVPWQVSLKVTNQVAYTKTIPPQHLRRMW